MSLSEYKGNLLTAVIEDAIIVHGCNMQGVMGAGFAKQLRSIYPEAYRLYRTHYEDNALYLGKALPVQVNENGLVIVNGITQVFYGRKPNHQYCDYNAISSVFRTVNEIAMRENKEVHFPKIGCGLAGGDWDIVQTLISATMDPSVSCGVWELK